MQKKEEKCCTCRGFLVLLMVSVVCFSTMACVKTPRVEKMSPLDGDIHLAGRFHHTVSVDAEWGVEVSRNKHGWGNDLTQEMFLEAVVSSLEDTKLFSAVVPRDQANYNLYATLSDVTLNLHDPVFGYVMSYTVTAKWKLVDAGTGETIFLEQIAAAGFGRAFNGITRNTVGREEGAKKNIIAGLQKISALGL